MKSIFFIILSSFFLNGLYAQRMVKLETLVDSSRVEFTDSNLHIKYGVGYLVYLKYYKIKYGIESHFNDSNVVQMDDHYTFLFYKANTSTKLGYLLYDFRNHYLVYFRQQNIYIMKSIDGTFKPTSLQVVLWKQQNCGLDVLHFHNCGFKEPVYDSENGILHYKKYRFFLFKVNKKININKLKLNKNKKYKGYGYKEYKWYHETK